MVVGDSSRIRVAAAFLCFSAFESGAAVVLPPSLLRGYGAEGAACVRTDVCRRGKMCADLRCERVFRALPVSGLSGG